MNKKFELLLDDTINVFGRKLFRIKAKINFGAVEAGELGGYIEKEDNLSVSGKAWVYCDAIVYGDARVSGDAKVYGNAMVSGNAHVYGDADVSGKAWVFGYAMVYGDAIVYGNATVSGDAIVCGNAELYRDYGKNQKGLPVEYEIGRAHV